MSKLRIACAACLLVAACGTSEPSSPLVLGNGAGDAVPGPQTLTAAQEEKLQAAIASAGGTCSSVEGAYLRDASAEHQTESWDVRCANDNYAVQIAAFRPAHVSRCLMEAGENGACVDPYNSHRRAPTQLNPDLGKLLEPLTAPNQKND